MRSASVLGVRLILSVSRPSRVVATALPGVVLAAQNLGVFWRHWFQNYCFPFDFSEAYYGMAAYTASALTRGGVPDWMPFQCMGYPLALNLQTGAHYPLLWLYGLLHIPYTLHAAVVLQCLHVLGGAVGMYVYAKHTLGRRDLALVAAVAFQFFGGFYSNSEHPDIVRAFALTPWVLYAASRPEQLSPRLLLLPPVVFLLATGGYPGNLIAMLFFVAIFLMAQLPRARYEGTSTSQAMTGFALAVAFVGLGLLMAAVHLGPAWIFRQALQRSHELDRIVRVGLPLGSIPGFLVGRPAPLDPAIMGSVYLPLPLLVGLFFVPASVIRRQWVEGLGVLVAALMAAGTDSLFWHALSRAVPPLRLSRYPASDYRAIFAVLLLLFAVEGLSALTRARFSRSSLTLRAGVAALLIGQALFDSRAVASRRWLTVGLAVLLASLALAVVLGRSSPQLAPVLLAAVAAMTIVDARRTLPAMKTWADTSTPAAYAARGLAHDWEGGLPAAHIFSRTLRTRPPRVVLSNAFDFSWRGYLDGTFMLRDRIPCLLAACQALDADPRLRAFMSREWLAILLPDDRRTVEPVVLTADQIDAALGPEAKRSGAVVLESYGIDQIRYHVTLPAATLMFENEIYFPGWRAALGDAPRQQEVAALRTETGLRGWRLPAGDYMMTARFRLPYLAWLRASSVAAGLVWLVAVSASLVRRARARAVTAQSSKGGG